MRFHCTINSSAKKVTLATIFLLVIEINMIVIYTYTMVDDDSGSDERGLGKEEAVMRVKRVDPPDFEPDSEPDLDSSYINETINSESDLDSSYNESNETTERTTFSDLGSGDGGRERNETEIETVGQHEEHKHDRNRFGLITEPPSSIWSTPNNKNHKAEMAVTDQPIPSTPKLHGNKKNRPSLQHLIIPSPPVANESSKLPDAIVIGSKFSGATLLLDILKYHPQIAIANTTNFYNWPEVYRKGVEWYIGHLPSKRNGQVLIEKSVNMFSNQDAPARLKRVESNMKLIVILRNPVERSYMEYLSLGNKGKGVATDGHTFKDSITNQHNRITIKNNFIRGSLYDVHLTNWFKYFNITQFLFLDHSQLLSRPFATLSRVERFLKIQSFFHKYSFVYNKEQMVCLNKKYFKDHLERPKCLVDEMPPLGDETLPRPLETRLRNFFAPHMEKTLSLLSGSLELEDMVSLVVT